MGRKSILKDFYRLDFNREKRCATPEIIFAEKKDYELVLEIAGKMLKRCGRAIISRVDPRLLEAIRNKFGEKYLVKVNNVARMAVIRAPEYPERKNWGIAGIITAGTSDVAVAEEARFILEEMGHSVISAYDVGTSGIHRLARPLEQMLKKDVDVFVVVAGMDGILPTIVKGLVDRPVIGVPTSVGYGVGLKGLVALATMLNSCAPGMVVVNIDNGVGAGIAASLIIQNKYRENDKGRRND